MSVRTKLGLPVSLQKIEPVPQRRYGVSCARMGSFDIESGGERGNRCRRHEIRGRLSFSDPLPQMRDVDLQCRSLRIKIKAHHRGHKEGKENTEKDHTTTDITMLLLDVKRA